MNEAAVTDGRERFETEAERLQELLERLEELRDPAARDTARELVRVVIGLHGLGLADLLAIVREAGNQPADTLLPRFAANPAVRGLLLLHDLHPDDLAERARQAIERLRPHLGVRGVRAEFVAVEAGTIRIRVSAEGQKGRRPAAAELRREIEDTVLELAPDASDIAIEGLAETGGSLAAYVPLSAISRPDAAGAGAG